MTKEQRAEQIYRGNTIEEEAYKNGYDDGFMEGADYMKQRAFNWMLKNVRLIGSPMELKSKYESEV